MIIKCDSCSKKFEIDQNLIPKIGRLLQCSSCNHKWFFKNDIVAKTIESPINENLKIFDNKETQENDIINIDNKNNIQTKNTSPTEKIKSKEVSSLGKKKQKNNFLNLIIVFIITIIALVILLDTFNKPISLIVPGFENLLYNLYESIKDIALFIKDLI